MGASRQCWLHEDVVKILDARTQRVPVKTLARRYDTTPNAIQKVLQKYKHPKSLEKLKELQKQRPSRRPPLRFRYRLALWVELEDVLKWLEKEKVDITVRESEGAHFRFRLGSRYLSPTQLVYEANRRRLMKGLEVFWVYGISRDV